MALVEVPDRRLDPQGADRPHAADAEDQLLVEPHLAAADVEDVGDRPVGSPFSGMSVSRRRTGDAADLGAARRRPGGRGPGSSTRDRSGSPSRPWTRLSGRRVRS